MIAAFPGINLAAYALDGLRRRRGIRPTPACHRVALLAVGALQDLGLDRVALQAEFGEQLAFQHLAAACDCCVAGPMLAVTLGRLLRTGPFEDVLVLVDARTHLEGLERALSRVLSPHLSPQARRSGSSIHREGLMSDAQRALLLEPARAGHQAALDLVAWAGIGMSFIGQA